MISKLAKSTIEKWQNEGLKPTFDDIILLNALGLKVEHGSEACEFSAVPRVAFLGDYTLFEPTVYKQIWIDTNKALIKNDYQTQLYFLAYALHTPDAELPSVKNIKSLMKELKKFALEVLVNFTETQILMAVNYVLTGADPTSNEDFTPEQKQAHKETYDVPEETYSAAKQLLAQALSYGISDQIKYDLTLPQLERMIICAALHDGVDIMKNEHTQAAGKFYMCAGKMHERLLKENNNG